MGFGDDMAPNPAPACGQCADPQTKGMHSDGERELDALQPGCECHQEFGDSPCPKHGMEGA